MEADDRDSNDGIGAAQRKKEKKKSDKETSEFSRRFYEESKSSGKQMMTGESEETIYTDTEKPPLEETESWINKMKDIIDTHFEESSQLNQISDDNGSLVSSPQEVVVDIIQPLFAYLSRSSVPINDSQLVDRLLSTGADSIPQVRGEPTISDYAQNPFPSENTTQPDGPHPTSGFVDDATVFYANLGFLGLSVLLFCIFMLIGINKSDPECKGFAMLASTAGYYLSLGGIFSHGRIRWAKNWMKAAAVACWSAVSSVALCGGATFFPNDRHTHIAVITGHIILIVIAVSLAAWVRI